MSEVGTRFGCWVVVEDLKSKAKCVCDCGVEQVIRVYDLLNKKTSMCRGCASKLNMAGHGASDSPTYNSWLHMRSRCNNPDDKDYPNYGGRGITVDPLWDASFEAFLMMVGERPKDTTLDRIDSNSNYEPGNVRWATVTMQNRNQNSNIRIDYLGKTMVLSEWILELGLEKQEAAIRKRIERGMAPVKALTTSVKSRKKT